MPIPLRVCLYEDRKPAEFFGGSRGEEPFRAPFERLESLQVMGECEDWAELQTYLTAARIDAVVIDLDAGQRQRNYGVAQRVLELAPGCGVIGVSRNADPDVIIAAMRAGCSQFVRWPIDQDDLKAAVDRLRHLCLPAADSRRVCVISASGGSGATTIACNLAMELAHIVERPCALVDMDLQYGDVACAFDVKPRYSVADVCRAGPEIDHVLLESALENLPCGVSLLCRPEKIEDADGIPAEGAANMLRVLGQSFPYVVADLPRYFLPHVLATLEGADHVLIVTQLTVPQLRNATRIYEHFIRLGALADSIDIVLNRCNANFERVKPDEFEAHLGRPVFASIPNDYKRIGQSRDLGHPIVSDAPGSPARLAIQDMARRLIRREAEAEAAGAAGGGFLGRFRRKPKVRAEG